MKSTVKRNIALYFLSSIFGFSGIFITFFTVTWLTFKLTDSPSALGIVGFAQNIPYLFLSIYGGMIADKYDKKSVVIICLTALSILSLTSLVLVILNSLTFPAIILLSFLSGCILSVNLPSMTGLVRDIVPDQQIFSRVMGASTSLAKIGQVISSTLFSLIFTIMSAVGSFLFALTANIAAIILMKFIKNPAQQTGTQYESAVSKMITGLKYSVRSKPHLYTMLASTAVSIVFGFITYELPVIDSRFLGGGPVDLGILYFAGSAGGILSGVYLGRRKSSKNILKLFTVCILICGVSSVGMAISRLLWLDFIFALAIDFSLGGVIGISTIVLQLLTENSMRGRVLGVYFSFNWGITAVGTMLLGLLADITEVDTVLIIAGVGTIIAGVAYFLKIKKQKSDLNKLYKERDLDEEHRLI